MHAYTCNCPAINVIVWPAPLPSPHDLETCCNFHWMAIFGTPWVRPRQRQHPDHVEDVPAGIGH